MVKRTHYIESLGDLIKMAEQLVLHESLDARTNQLRLI